MSKLPIVHTQSLFSWIKNLSIQASWVIMCIHGTSVSEENNLGEEGKMINWC